MITTSTPALHLTEKKERETQNFEFPSVNILNSILNYSKNLEIKKSIFVKEIEIIKS